MYRVSGMSLPAGGTVGVTELATIVDTGWTDPIKVAAQLGIKAGETTLDGRFTLRGMECLAACDKAPMMHINNEVMHTNLTEAKLDQILQELAK